MLNEMSRNSQRDKYRGPMEMRSPKQPNSQKQKAEWVLPGREHGKGLLTRCVQFRKREGAVGSAARHGLTVSKSVCNDGLRAELMTCGFSHN